MKRSPKKLAALLGIVLGCSTLVLISTPSEAVAQQYYASKRRAVVATGHYARARTMLVKALEEFEAGRKHARPDLLIDSEEWRLSLISLTEQLNRVLDPRPRVTRDGVQFQADPVMIERQRDRLPAVKDGAKENNVYGEQQFQEEREERRARMYQEKQSSEQASEAPSEVEIIESESSSAKVAPQQAIGEMPTIEEKTASDLEAMEKNLEPSAETPTTAVSDEGQELNDEEQLAAAIEKEIEKQITALEEESQEPDVEPNTYEK